MVAMCRDRLDKGDWTWRDNSYMDRRHTKQDIISLRRVSFPNIGKFCFFNPVKDHSGKL